MRDSPTDDSRSCNQAKTNTCDRCVTPLARRKKSCWVVRLAKDDKSDAKFGRTRRKAYPTALHYTPIEGFHRIFYFQRRNDDVRMARRPQPTLGHLFNHAKRANFPQRERRCWLPQFILLRKPPPKQRKLWVGKPAAWLCTGRTSLRRLGRDLPDDTVSIRATYSRGTVKVAVRIHS